MRPLSLALAFLALAAAASRPAGATACFNSEVLVPPGLCAFAAVASTNLGAVRGRLLDPQGRPAARRWVYLAPPGDLPSGSFPVPSEAVETDGEGRWSIGLVPAGEYVLLADRARGETHPLIPRIFFPGTRERKEAVRVQVRAATEREVADFRLPPPLIPRRIAGVLRWSDGRPVDGVRVSLREPGVETNAMTDADGTFELSGFAERTYEILGACQREGGVLATERRKVTPGNGDLRLELVLDRPAPAYGAEEAYWLEPCAEPD